MHPSNAAGRPRHYLRSATAALAILAFAACTQDSSTAPTLSASKVGPSPRFSQASDNNKKIPDQYIVVFDGSVGDVRGRANALLNAHGGNLEATYSNAIRGFSAHMSAQAAAALDDEPGVAFVEQDQQIQTASAQNGAPWALDRIDQATGMDGIYNYSATGAGVNVYIIDSGIRHTHSEFGGRVVPAFTAFNDAYGADGCLWHGTHVAGIVGGAFAGVAKGATLYSVRVFDCTATSAVSTLVSGIDWVVANRRSPAVGMLAITSPSSTVLNDAVQTAINAGITFVTSSGNSTSDACGLSPSNLPAVLTVAGINSNDTQASFSGWGSCVDLYAPASNVYSALNTSDNAFGLASGTSMAAAHVAGAAALYLQANPSASPAAVHQAIVSSATAGVLGGVTAGTPNLLLHVNGSGGGTLPPPPPPAPPSGNAAPVANFSFSCSKASCTFDGSSSTDDAGVTSYSWNFGDGTSSTSNTPRASHVYSAKGNYSVTVQLTVSDGAGLTGSVAKSVTIRNKGR